MSIAEQAGFKNLTIQKSKEIILPDEILKEILNNEEYDQYLNSGVGIYRITLYGEKGMS